MRFNGRNGSPADPSRNCWRPYAEERAQRASRSMRPEEGRPSFETAASPPLRMRRVTYLSQSHDVKQRSLLRSRGALLRRGWSLSIRTRPEEGWAERRQAHYFICRVSETRRVRTQRGAARPMTRDARLSALHRGDFRPGAALPSPALPPDPYSDAPRSQVIMPGGRCPGPPESAVTSRGRRTPLPAPPTGSSLEDAPP
jgi:hypothetical protein